MDIQGKKISILGAVRSGISSAKLALSQGATPFVSDLSIDPEIINNCNELNDLGIKCEYGSHSDKVFDCDFIITSPGVPKDAKILIDAENKGIKIVSEIEFASWFCKGNIIAITGTNGKTTTTSLCAHVINSSGRICYTAGNIGLPFSDISTKVGKDEYVALEVSSFQLDFIEQFKPKYSVLLNITPDHLDRYENRFDLYIKSKMNLVKNQLQGDIFVYNGDDANIPVGYVNEKTQMFPFSIDKSLSNGCFLDDDCLVYSNRGTFSDICTISDLSLKGEHNMQNSLAVINVAMNIGIHPEQIKNALSNFEGVEHRLEFVKEVNGITFINDSKATNVDSLWYALRSFNDPIILILGGKDKGNDYNQVRDEVKKRVKLIYAIGSSGNKIYDFFKNYVRVEIVESFEIIKKNILHEASLGDIVLLSPACASFDMFKNYEDRGVQFKELVNRL